jgi:hypothetical protein
MMTLKAGIERILMDRVPGVTEVTAVADAPEADSDGHATGIDISGALGTSFAPS